MTYKPHAYRSVIPTPNQLTLPLNEYNDPAKRIIYLPPANYFDDPDVIRAAIEKVKLENRKGGGRRLSYKQAIW